VSSTFKPQISTQEFPTRKSLIEWVVPKLTRNSHTREEQSLQKRTALSGMDRLTKEDLTETLKWYRRSAEKGDAWAQLRLGHAYQQGKGVEPNEAEALVWYRRAVAQGQYNLGVRYAQGLGVMRDYGQTVRWYTLAAHLGHARAQVNLGSMYCKGYGVMQDLEQAVKWYRLAAEQGDSIAQYNLAVSYLKGQGVVRDCLQAHLWFSRSAEGGDKQAVESRDKLASNMTVSQLNEARRLAQ
jgi:uncharacterized protein